MINAHASAYATLFAIALLAAPASAQTLYKLIDKDGKVTYSEKPPKDFAGKVVPMDIDPNRNTATLPKPTQEEAGRSFKRAPPGAKKESGEKGVDSEDRLKQAQERLEAARTALKDAQDNPGPDDVFRAANEPRPPGKFRAFPSPTSRPIASEAYAKRLADLEQKVKAAEEDVKRAEDAR